MRPASAPSRRLSSRVQATGHVWAYWHCQGHDDLSPVRDMSIGGLFLETGKKRPAGMLTRLDFLVDEGQVRADAVVRYVLPGTGLGLKFTAINEKDRVKLAGLLMRLRRIHPAAELP